MSTTKPRLSHTDAHATLRTINAALRRAEDLHWTDPAFLEWERGQVGVADVAPNHHDGVDHTRYAPGSSTGRYTWSCHVQPMIRLYDDQEPGSVKRIYAADYPDEVTMSGPLMLGPEPEKVEMPASPAVLFEAASDDVSLFSALARRLHLPHATEEGLRAFAMHRQSGYARGGVIAPAGITNRDFRWGPCPGRANAAAAAITRFSDNLIASVSRGVSALAPLMPELPRTDDARSAALARRQQDQPWHTFTAGPQNQRRGH